MPTTTPSPTPTPNPTPDAIVDVGYGSTNVYRDESSGTSTTIIAIGRTVQWKWINGYHDSDSGTCRAQVPRTCTSDGVWESPDLHQAGDVWSRVFTTAGEYPYFCSFHGYVMRGRVIVVAPSPTPTITGTRTSTPTPVAPTATQTPKFRPTSTVTPQPTRTRTPTP